MNQNTIDLMYGLRDLLKKHRAEIVAYGSDDCFLYCGQDEIELSHCVSPKEIQKWLDTPGVSE